MLGKWAAAAFGVGMAALGVAAVVAPPLASRLYGVPQDDPDGQAWVRAAGLRDLGLSAALGALLAADRRPAAGIVCLATAAIAVGDAANLRSRRSAVAAPLILHGAGIGLGAISGALLLRRPRGTRHRVGRSPRTAPPG